jgi:hypothetical protein
VIKLSIFLSLTILTSCSSIQFISTNKIPATFEFKDDKSSKVSIEIDRSFFIWGLYPEVQVVKIDDVFEKKGFSSVSDLAIKEVNIRKKALWMFFTFGMYYPQSYKLIAKAN